MSTSSDSDIIFAGDSQSATSDEQEADGKNTAAKKEVIVDTVERGKKLVVEAVTVLQERLRQNDQLVSELHSRLEDEDRACRALRRRAEVALQEANAMKEQQEEAKRVMLECSRRRVQCEEEARDRDLSLRRAREASPEQLSRQAEALQEQCRRAREEAATEEGMRLRAEVSVEERAGQLAEIQAECSAGRSGARAEADAELERLLVQADEELSERKVQHAAEMSRLRAAHDEEVAELQAALKAASARRDEAREERNAAAAELSMRLREGTQLRQLCAATREEVLELSVQVRDALWRAPDPSPLDELLELAEDSDSELEHELQVLRRRCHTLELECSRSADLLEARQVSKGFEDSGEFSGQFSSQLPGCEVGQRAGRPFVLGPDDGDDAATEGGRMSQAGVGFSVQQVE